MLYLNNSIIYVLYFCLICELQAVPPLTSAAEDVTTDVNTTVSMVIADVYTFKTINYVLIFSFLFVINRTTVWCSIWKKTWIINFLQFKYIAPLHWLNNLILSCVKGYFYTVNWNTKTQQKGVDLLDAFTLINH